MRWPSWRPRGRRRLLLTFGEWDAVVRAGARSASAGGGGVPARGGLALGTGGVQLVPWRGPRRSSDGWVAVACACEAWAGARRRRRRSLSTAAK